jgi:hypothetical protein
MSSQKSVADRIREINAELELLERERTGLVAAFRGNRKIEIKNGKIPARDIGVLRPGEQTDADRQEAILRSNMAIDDQARREGLMTA